MSAHRINFTLQQAALSGALDVADPGDGGTFEVGDRLIAYCDVTPADGSESRELPTNSDSVPRGTRLFIRNKSDTHDVTLNAGAVSVTLAANTAREVVKTNYVGDLPRHWLFSAAFDGGS